MTIQILPTDVVDQIAAGEVVERPAHLVKELVENSLDAKATQVIVEIASGGRSIKVGDDGQGIPSSELPLALKRFATSKIKASADLWKLRSFGFRGEALASIASVSKLNLISRTDEMDKGSQILSEYGKFSDVHEVSHRKGTTIHVENLFENIPARLKFLKSPSAEHQQIKNVLKALALTHPKVEIKVFEEGKLWALWNKKETRLERARLVLENENLFHTTLTRDGINVEIVFGDPHFVQRTSKQIWIFAQNRWVQDRSIQASVMEAYRNMLMHGEFPTCCVWVDVDPSDIDINIHPAKSAVKFVDPSKIFKAVHRALRDALEKAPWHQISLTNEVVDKPTVSDDDNLYASEYAQYQAASAAKQSSNQTLFETSMSTFSPIQVKQKIGFEEFKNLGERKAPYTVEAGYSPLSGEPIDFAAELLAQSLQQDLNDTANLKQLRNQQAEKSASQGTGHWSSLHVVGQVGLTYLVCESRDGMTFVDQHAAHERVMFEKLMDGYRKNSLAIQRYLIPLAVELAEDQREAVEKHIDDFLRLGIEIEILGPMTVGIVASPTGIKERAIHEVVRKTADELVDLGSSHAFEKNLGEIFSTMACHSAIRAGQALSLEEMKQLLKEMDEFPLSSFCPHGRPVSVSYPFNEVEKDFGRRV